MKSHLYESKKRLKERLDYEQDIFTIRIVQKSEKPEYSTFAVELIPKTYNSMRTISTPPLIGNEASAMAEELQKICEKYIKSYKPKRKETEF